jgi:lipoprotein signal peptidase
LPRPHDIAPNKERHAGTTRCKTNAVTHALLLKMTSSMSTIPHRSILWGRFTGIGLAVALAAAVLDQASKLWLIFVTDLASRGPIALTPFLDLVLTWNAIDRLAYGAVADFVLFHITTGSFNFRWYVFNIADVAIVVGVAGLIDEMLLGSEGAKK